MFGSPFFFIKFEFQELRSYSWLLLNFLNEKVQEINALADKSIQLKKGRRDRLKTRRRMDVKDQYTECTAAAAGKNVQVRGISLFFSKFHLLFSQTF